MEERKKTPTWVWVLVGVIGFCVLALVVVVGGGIYMFRQHVQTESASTQDVQKEFEQTRQRFTGQQPLVEVRKSDTDDRQVVVHKPLETAERQTNLKSIRVLAYDPRQGRVVRVDVPVWLARMAMSERGGSGRRRITVNGEDIDFDAGDLTFEDVERHGPGLIVDTSDDRGGKVIVWAE
jgi:hypothetical protein